MNNFLMPNGLSLTLILTPLFIFLIEKKASILNSFFYLFILFLLYFIIHHIGGVENYTNYLKTSLLLCSAIILIVTMYLFFKKIDLSEIFKLITIINFIFFIASLLTLFIPSLKSYLWSFKPISNGIDSLPRLQMFTPEPSHYALLLIPLVLYFFLKLIIEKVSKENLFYFILIIIPFLVALSFGAIFILFLSIAIINLLYPRRLLFSKKNIKYTLIGFFIILIFGIAAHKFKPDNPISKRITMIVSGEDTSANGRTTQSFGLAKDVAKNKSFLFGVGPGQSKIIAQKYYFKNLPYRQAMPETIRFSNVSATTLASYGVLGLILRNLFLLLLFVKFKVYKNIFGTSIFIFMFIFQFMASYMINVSEISIWVIAILSYSKSEFKWANA